MAEAAATDKHGKFGARRTSSRGLVFFLDAEPVQACQSLVLSCLFIPQACLECLPCAKMYAGFW